MLNTWDAKTLAREKETLIDIADMPPLIVACVTSVSMFSSSRLYAVQPEQMGEFIPDPDTPEFARFIAKKDSLRASSDPGAVQQIALARVRFINPRPFLYNDDRKSAYYRYQYFS
jgi:hypothetical protein